MYKFKGLLVVLLIMLLAVPLMAKKVKTVDEKDGLVTDLRLKYTIQVQDNWKVKKFKEKTDEPKVFRTFFSQKNYQINADAREYDADFTIPEIQVYAMQTDMTPQVFMDSLEAAVKWHNSQNEIINKLNLIISGEYIQDKEVILAGEPCIQAFFKRSWERKLQADPDDPRYRHSGGLVVQDIYDVHIIYILSHSGWLYVLQGVAELEFYEQVEPEINEIIASLKFADQEQAETTEE